MPFVMYRFLAAVIVLTHTSAEDLCTKYSSPEVVDDLLERTRNQLPSSFMLPDRVGFIGIYSANITNLNTFRRSPERQIICNGNTVEVPVIWYRKPTGRFMVTGRQLNFIRKVHEVTIGILEARMVIEFRPMDNDSAVAVLKTLTVTRLSKIEMRAIGFGMIGRIISKITTLIIRFFEAVFHAFMEDNLKHEIETAMVHVPVVKYFPTFFFNNDFSVEEDTDDTDSTLPDVNKHDVTETGKNPRIAINPLPVDGEKEEDEFEVFGVKTEKPVIVKEAEDDTEVKNRENEGADWWIPGEDEVEVFGTKQENEMGGIEMEEAKANEKPKGPVRPSKGNKELEGEVIVVGSDKDLEVEDNYDPKLDFEKLDPRFRKHWVG